MRRIVDTLSPKQQRFVLEYLRDYNATAAAERAGYAHPNKQGPRLLVNVGVAEAVKAGLREQEERIKVDADRVLRELKLIATSDPGEIFDFSRDGEPTLRPANTIPPMARRLISSLKIGKYGPEVKLWSKDAALDKLMRHFGLYKDKVDLNVNEVKLTVEDLAAADRELEEWTHGSGPGEDPGLPPAPNRVPEV
jgi:phage terminase small subunit